MKGHLAQMLTRHARDGRLDWIGLRPARKSTVQSVEKAVVDTAGLTGDHSRPGKRAVTLIQSEHLPVIAALLGRDRVDPLDLRRNLVISGINLAALRNHPLRIGAVTLRIEGPCHPCSRMEQTFGHGGYNALRGHGGWYASVITGGEISTGDLCQRDAGHTD